MFIRGQVFRTAVAVWVSAMMALPAPTWAQGQTSVSAPGDAKEGDVPVLLQPIQIPNGRGGTMPAYWALAAISDADEAAAVTGILQATKGENTTLVAADLNDPVLPVARKSGFFKKVKTFFAGDGSDSPLLNSSEIPASQKSKMRQVVSKVTDFCKAKRVGLMTSVIVAGIYSSFILYESSSINAGLSALIALTGWFAFQSMAPKLWDGYLDGGGEFVAKTMSAVGRLFGRELSDSAKHIYEVTGKFSASLVANTAIVSFMFYQAGTLTGFWTALYYGLLASTDINDANVSNKVRQGVLSHAVFEKYIPIRIIAAGAFEVLSFLHVPYVQESLVTIAIGGFAYLAYGHYVENYVVPKAKAIKEQTARSMAEIKRLNDLRRNGLPNPAVLTSCAQALGHSMNRAEDAAALNYHGGW